MKQLTLFIALISLLIGCTNTNSNTTLQGEFAHTVYFWLNNPDKSEDRAAFEKSLTKFLDASAYIVTKHVGTPAATTHRDVVDGSYTYSLLLTFKSAEDEAKYQKEDVHLTFIDESKHLWNKVVVYDSENILK